MAEEGNPPPPQGPTPEEVRERLARLAQDAWQAQGLPLRERLRRAVRAEVERELDSRLSGLSGPRAFLLKLIEPAARDPLVEHLTDRQMEQVNATLDVWQAKLANAAKIAFAVLVLLVLPITILMLAG